MDQNPERPPAPYDAGTFVIHSADRDVIATGSDPRPKHRRGQGRGQSLLATVVSIAMVLAVVVVGGGTVVAYRTLSGGGPQPETWAPASTFAFAKLDLDPSAGE